jgi:site-specific DNA recombinase
VRFHLAGESIKCERTTQQRRKRTLEAERKKLLDAHLADAVPLDLLETEQERIAADLGAVEG